MPTVERLFLAVGITLAAYTTAAWVRRKGLSGLHPSLIAAPLLIGSLWLLGWPIEQYQADSRVIGLLVGPATVALTIPIYKHRQLVRANWQALLAGVLTGCLIGIGSSVIFVLAFGMGPGLVRSVAPRTVGSTLAPYISEQLGGIPPLSLAMAQITAILGASFGPLVLNMFRVRNKLAIGLALGTAAHTAGIDRARQSGEVEGAASSLALGLNTLVGALLIPPVVRLLLAILA